MTFWSLDYIVPVVSVHEGQLEKFSSQTRAYLIPPTILLMGGGALLPTYLTPLSKYLRLLLASLPTMGSSSFDFLLSLFFKKNTL